MSDAADDQRLADQLVSSGLLNRESLQACLEIQRRHGGPAHKPLWEILVEQGCLSSDDVKATLAVSSADDITMVAPSDTPEAMDMAISQSAEVSQALADPTARIGSYLVLEEVGRGGMGVVYRCHDPKLEREVAIKMLLSRQGPHSEDRIRFQREAMAAAKIRHPGIVAVHEVGEHQGSPYLVMDFVTGETFESALKQRRLSRRQVVEIVREMALALDHIHDAGICHRDVKPQNVILDAHGHPQIMDFGLARDSSARQQLTHTGQVVGTPSYMAPEQVDSEAGDQGPWTDVYALGVVLYRALAGELPFHGGATVELFRRILMEDPPSLRQRDSSIDPDLETVTFKCLEKELDRRYPSAAAVAEELQRHLDGQAIVARPMGSLERLGRWSRHNRSTTLSLVALAVVVVGALVTGAVVIQRHQRDLRASKLAATRRERALERSSARERLAAETALTMARREATRLQREAKEEATREARDRLEKQELAALETGVSEILGQLRSGQLELDPLAWKDAQERLLGWRQLRTVQMLAGELAGLTRRLAEDGRLSGSEGEQLKFLCDGLAGQGLREVAVDALGRYLEAEVQLSSESRNQLRAVPAGLALCRLGGEAAESALRQTRKAFGLSGLFWGQVQPRFGDTGVKPRLEHDSAVGYTHRGYEKFQKGDLAGAMADYTRAIELDHRVVEAWVDRGTLRKQQGDHAGAIADYTRAIELDPGMLAAWFGRASARKASGDLRGAIADGTRAIELAPAFAMAWNNRGLTRGESGDLAGAMADYGRAIDLDPLCIQALTNRGESRLAQRDPAGAVADLTRAIEVDPTFMAAWRARGKARMALGDQSGGMSDLTRAIELAPTDAMSWSQRGTARTAQGDVDGAIADFSRALEVDPGEARVWCNRALSWQRKGEHERAIADCTRSIELAPQLARPWGVRGVLRSQVGDASGAIADFERFVELAPGAPQAAAARAEIERLRGSQGDGAGN